MGTCTRQKYTTTHKTCNFPPAEIKTPPSPKCEKSSQSMSARPVSRWVTPAGSCTASSTASSQTVRCQATRPSAAVTTVSTPSSLRLVPASTYHELCSSISSQPLLTRCELALTDSSFTQSS